MQAVKAVHVRALADDFIVRSDRWLTKLANNAMRALKLRLADRDDLKNDLIVRIYEIAQLFDEERGIPFNKYIVGTLKFHLYSNRTQQVYFNTVAGKPTINLGAFIQGAGTGMESIDVAHQLEDKREISSLEVAADVFKHVDGLDAHDQLLIELVFTRRLQYKQIEEMLGVAHGTIWHRMQTIIRRIQSTVSSCPREDLQP
jgi:RNA polymerase sigma factor (sigma-70 family)